MFAQTKLIGDINEMKCMTAFMELGITVLKPMGDRNRYDFAIEIDGKFLRIQAKASHTDDNGKSFIFNNKSNNTIQGELVSNPYTKEEIDFYATMFNNRCYLIPVEDCGTTAKRLRLVPTANNQQKGISWAFNYEIEKVLQEYLESLVA